MAIELTVSQIEALSPDAGNLKRGKGLANERKWETLATKEDTIWGLCKGSGKNPYKVQIDLSEPAYKCSCPSRKFPCKHSIGLMLLYANNQSGFATEEHPDWVTEWLGKREKSKVKKADNAKEEKVQTEKQKAAQAKRAAKRMSGIEEGIKGLQTWLYDVVRLGLADLQQQNHHYFEERGARLVDAKAPGLGNVVKSLHSTLQGKDWQEKTLGTLGYLYTVSNAFLKRDQLDETMKANINSLVGINIKKDKLLETATGIIDEWYVLGKRHEQDKNDHRLNIQRTWLYGKENKQFALILDFSFLGKPFETHFIPGSFFRAEMVFFPGYPQRAIVKKTLSDVQNFQQQDGYQNITDFFDGYANALAENPFLMQFPTLLNNVNLVKSGKEWVLQDSDLYQIPIKDNFNRFWEMLAISGGKGMTVFGEWHGDTLLPLGASINGGKSAKKKTSKQKESMELNWVGL